MKIYDMNAASFEESRKSSVPVLVDYWAPWCIYCRRIAPAYDRIAAEYEGRLIAGRVNIDEEEALARMEEIEVIPTLVLYQGGQAVGSIVAPQSKAEIDRFIKESLGW